MLSYQEWQIDAPMQLELARKPLGEFLLAAAIGIDAADPAISGRVFLKPGEGSSEQKLTAPFYKASETRKECLRIWKTTDQVGCQNYIVRTHCLGKSSGILYGKRNPTPVDLRWNNSLKRRGDRSFQKTHSVMPPFCLEFLRGIDKGIGIVAGIDVVAGA
jgi:hypothetical protein